MSTNRAARVKHLRRPKKAKAEKLRRQKEQKKRLVKLGMDEQVVAKLPVHKVRSLVQKPAKVKKTLARAAAKAKAKA